MAVSHGASSRAAPRTFPERDQRERDRYEHPASAPEGRLCRPRSTPPRLRWRGGGPTRGGSPSPRLDSANREPGADGSMVGGPFVRLPAAELSLVGLVLDAPASPGRSVPVEDPGRHVHVAEEDLDGPVGRFGEPPSQRAEVCMPCRRPSSLRGDTAKRVRSFHHVDAGRHKEPCAT